MSDALWWGRTEVRHNCCVIKVWNSGGWRRRWVERGPDPPGKSCPGQQPSREPSSHNPGLVSSSACCPQAMQASLSRRELHKSISPVQPRLNSFWNCPSGLFFFLSPLWEHRKPHFPNPEISVSGRKGHCPSRAACLWTDPSALCKYTTEASQFGHSWQTASLTLNEQINLRAVQKGHKANTKFIDLGLNSTRKVFFSSCLVCWFGYRCLFKRAAT